MKIEWSRMIDYTKTGTISRSKILHCCTVILANDEIKQLSWKKRQLPHSLVARGAMPKMNIFKKHYIFKLILECLDLKTIKGDIWT